MKKWIPFAVAVLGLAWMLRSLFPETREVVQRPRIVTMYDTVKAIDTTWITKVRKEVQHDTVFAERVIVTPPETVYVGGLYRGITFVNAGKKVGDSTLVKGWKIEIDTVGSRLSNWQVQYWTGGPLHTLDADSLPPRISFYSGDYFRGKDCGFFCKVEHWLQGGAVGYGVCALAK